MRTAIDGRTAARNLARLYGHPSAANDNAPVAENDRGVMKGTGKLSSYGHGSTKHGADNGPSANVEWFVESRGHDPLVKLANGSHVYLTDLPTPLAQHLVEVVEAAESSVPAVAAFIALAVRSRDRLEVILDCDLAECLDSPQAPSHAIVLEGDSTVRVSLSWTKSDQRCA